MQQATDGSAPLRLSLFKLAGPTILGNLLLSLVHLAAIKIVASLGATGPGDMGRVMAAVKAQLAGKADMGAISAAVKSALSK